MRTYNRISADCHLDLIWLPPDLFTSEAPAHLKDRMRTWRLSRTPMATGGGSRRTA